MENESNTQRLSRLPVILPYILIVCGAIALVASAVLMVDKIHTLQDPAYRPFCNINPFFSCVTVASSPQASVFFGIPNMVFGLIGFSVVLTLGVVALSGITFQRWFWRATNIGLLAAMALIVWLITQTLYVIGALCIYCMVVWVMTSLLFWYTTLYNLQQHNWPMGRLGRFGNWLIRNHDLIIATWFVLIVAAIVQRFWVLFRFFL